MSLDSLFTRMKQGEAKDLALIVKADVHGSEEVLVQTLNKLSTEKVKVSVLHSGVGAISVNDVLLASASEAIIIGFNVKPEKKAQELADKEGVDIRLYSVIYTLTDEIKKAMTGLLDTRQEGGPSAGTPRCARPSRSRRSGTIAGLHGHWTASFPRSASVRLVRDNRVIYEGKIGSLRRFKDDASEVKQGFECGIGIAGYQDVKVGDVIEAFVIEEVAAVADVRGGARPPGSPDPASDSWSSPSPSSISTSPTAGGSRRSGRSSGPLKARLRGDFEISAAEVAHQDLLQRAVARRRGGGSGPRGAGAAPREGRRLRRVLRRGERAPRSRASRHEFLSYGDVGERRPSVRRSRRETDDERPQ